MTRRSNMLRLNQFFHYTVVLLLGLTTSCGVGNGSEDPVAQAHSSVANPNVDPTKAVYGEDNRKDVYEYPIAVWQERAMLSNVALIYREDLDFTDVENIKQISVTLQQDKTLCPGERFSAQPTAAFCSGTLIDDDKILTAGHCITNQDKCNKTAIVFHYMMDSADQPTVITSQDVFQCTKVLAQKWDWNGVDFSIVQLDRPATPRFVPAPIRRLESALDADQQLLVMGSGSGLPTKIDDGGRVRDPRDSLLDYFVANTDTFGGNSGSGVYDFNSGEVVGILVRGEKDYVYDYIDKCNRVYVCQENGCRGEDVTYVFRAIKALCAQVSSEKLCGTPGNSADIQIVSPDTPLDIPDNSSVGITSQIEVNDPRIAESVEVQVHITHPFIGDLIVELECPNGAVSVLHNQEDGSDDNLYEIFSIPACNGQAAQGVWKLSVKDVAKSDKGILDNWILKIKTKNDSNDSER